MKTKIILLLIAASVQIAKAQDAYNFKETFDNNNKSWLIRDSKKNSAEIANGKYTLNNIDSKKPIVSLVEFPIDSTKEVTITVKAKKGNNGLNLSAGFGIAFAAKDEKNFYLFEGTPYKNFWLYGVEKGEWKFLGPVVSHVKKEELVLSVVLSPTEWKFFVDGEQIAKTKNQPFFGNKAGLVSVADQQCTFDDFEVKVQSAKAEPCPIPGSKNEIVQVIDKALCALKNDFADYVGERDYSVILDSTLFWKAKNLTLTGASSTYFGKMANKKHILSKEFIAIYNCANEKDFFAAKYLYDQFKYLINTITPTCTDKKIYSDKEIGVKGNLLKADTWIVGMPFQNKDYIKGTIELDLVFNENKYMVVFHVYQSN